MTQEEPKTDDSLAVFTPHAGLAITCNRLLNVNCVMPSIPAELFHEISLCFAVSPPYAEPRSTQIKEEKNFTEQRTCGVLEAVYLVKAFVYALCSEVLPKNLNNVAVR